MADSSAVQPCDTGGRQRRPAWGNPAQPHQRHDGHCPRRLFHPAARARGVAPTALGAICRWAFEAAGFHRIELSHAVENAPSCRVAVKAGFAAEGIMRSYLPKPGGGWWDVELHAAINPAD